MKNLYLIVGPSGTGKSTLVDKLVEYYDAKEVLSYTDRLPRYTGEGTHIFVSKEEFDKLPELVAFTNFSGHRYGVPSSAIDESDFYIIDPAGVLYLYKHYKGTRNLIVLGLTASDETLKTRLKTRDGDFLRRFHDRDIFTKSVMKLICDDIINTDVSIEDMLVQAKEIIDKYEK